jgi:hypothetical protein
MTNNGIDLAGLTATLRTAADTFRSIAWNAPDPEGDRMAQENDAATLTAREVVVLMAYQRLAADTWPATATDEQGNRWGVVVFLDDMVPLVSGDLNGLDEVRAAALSLAARTEGEFSSIVTDEFGETRVVFEAGILG